MESHSRTPFQLFPTKSDRYRIPRFRPLQKSALSLFKTLPSSVSSLTHLSLPLSLPLNSLSLSKTLTMSSSSAVHPLTQIAESPTHKLLLKQWLNEETLIARRISLKESRMDAVRREIISLYCSFFIFHSIILLLLLSSSSSPSACRRSWVPCLCSVAISMAILWAIRYKTDTEAHIEKLLEREKEDGVLLFKCVEELKRKGTEFDLLKEVDALRRAKSLRVETMKGGDKVRKWSARDLVMLVLFGASVGVLALTRVVMCSH